MATPKSRGILGFSAKKKTAPEPAAGAPSSDKEAPEQAPLFSVVKGNPTEEELVALTMAVVSAQEAQKKSQSANAAAWQRVLNRRQKLGVHLRPGPGAWRRAQPR